MDPNHKLLLDGIDKRSAARFDGLERNLDSTAASSSTRLDALESGAKVFDEWRPDIDGAVDDLRDEVKKLSSLKLEVGKISKFMQQSLVDGPTSSLGVHGPVLDVLAPAPSLKNKSAPASPSAATYDVKPTFSPKSLGYADYQVAPRSSAGTLANSPHGHRIATGNHDGVFGVVSTRSPARQGYVSWPSSTPQFSTSATASAATAPVWALQVVSPRGIQRERSG